MNENRSLIWKWAVGLLVLCNIALVATIWLKPGQEQTQERGPMRETPRDFLIRNVKFDDRQVKQYDVLITAHRHAMDSLHKAAMECRQLLFGNLKDGNGTKFNPDSLATVIANTQREIELVTYHHFEQVRTICTEPQKVEFDKVIGDVISKMNGGRHNGPPPPDRDGPPRDGEHDGPPPGDHDGPPPPGGPPQ